MASDLSTKAKEAYIDDHFELAVDLYSQAIAVTPNNPELFADRAQANIKLHNFTEAVTDANTAIELDPSTAKAYMRKGLACMELEEYQTAKAALETGASLAPGESRFTSLIKECDEHIAGKAGELPKHATVETSASVVPPAESKSLDNVAAVTKDTQLAYKSCERTPAVKPKYRHEFYQKPDEVVVTIFAKGIPAKNVSVDFGEQILSVSIDIPGEVAYSFQPRLFGKIIPQKCRYEVMSTKFEIRLAKAESVHWTTLEYTRDIAVVQRPNVSSGSYKPSYPSSKLRCKDWDKLEAQVKKEEKEEKLDGDAALNKFFRDIYKDADEDARRAMMKSFVESNGTVLSTNWKEVGTKKVEGSPPDGMELKQWEY
ncbi:Protein SGT1 -like protein [Capsicum annuum]|uniref:Protein SGT1 homolog n=1 Tax=Capsicum annuum TaxID=4072 RepID=A0A023GU62_CAPAN|nr:protein SGT1 homolog A-like [Capsicum annuum]AER93283.1 SGT1 [Capsicum annuum]KAF3629158.1 Protein SGT1 -like protein [Capsicum annuum]